MHDCEKRKHAVIIDNKGRSGFIGVSTALQVMQVNPANAIGAL
jgi:hypothetical protein